MSVLLFFIWSLTLNNNATRLLFVSGRHKITGSNRWGQLGRGDTNTTGDDPDEMGDNLIPVNLGTGQVASELALGEEHTCMLLESGDVKVGQGS